MKVAYLINQYPKVSHSFIRREIIALEALGVSVYRYTIRSTPVEELVDAGDISECSKTEAILQAGMLRLLLCLITVILNSPISFVRALSIASIQGKKSRRGVLRHLVYLVEACFLKMQLIKQQVTHLHAHFGTNSATVAMLCKILGGPAYSFTVHGPEEFDDPVGLALKMKIEKSKFVVAISSYGRSQLMRQSCYEQWSKIKIVHCAVDNNFLVANDNALTISPDSKVTCVGRLCEQKGQLLLVEALALLHHEGIEFKAVLAGDGPMRREIEKCINNNGLQDKIRITGWLNGDEIKNVLLASRIMVLPSFAEGLPVVIMEAFALGRPVLSTFIAGIPELVEHRKSGWLVPAGDVNALAEVLMKALSTSAEDLFYMGLVGRKKVQENHCDTTEARKLMQLMTNCG